MSRLFKAGILLFVLVVPAFVFLFLKFFGHNHFTLPRFFPVVNTKTGAIQTRFKQDSRWWEQKQDTLFYTLRTVTGNDSYGGLFTTQALNGTIHVASFIGNTCDSTCSNIIGQLSRLQDVFSGNPDVKLVSYVDENKLRIQLANEYGEQADKWLFIHPDNMKTATVAEYSYLIKQRPITGRKIETFTLYEGLVLVDKQGQIRGFYNGVDKTDVDRLILEIRVLKDLYADHK